MTAIDLQELSLADIQVALADGRLSAESLTSGYLERIQRIDRDGPGLRAVIELNPQAREIARALDLERRVQGPRSAMHGVAVLIKDNIATRARMQTTAGSLALLDSAPAL